MIRKFVRERISWIMVVLALQLLGLVMAFLDSAISFSSMFYYVFLSTVIFVLFIVIRFHRETNFFLELLDREDNLDKTSLPEASSPFEEIVEKSITKTVDHLKHESSRNKLMLEQEKDELLSWIHEVKTPMTTMHLIIDRIGDLHVKADLTREWLRIHLLLDQQLHQKRIPFIENDLYIEEVKLNTIIVEEITTLRSWCMQKDIGIEINLQVETVLSDAKWLAFIIRQLVTNAVKYSNPSSEILIISRKQNGRTFLQVMDNGRGIDPKDLPRIFDKGFTSTNQHGDHAATGMGLYLAKAAAESLLIHIKVESKVGIGSTFSLFFSEKNEFEKTRGM
ncbi:sensor histidine kinase [Aquibacillus kalidii]|uniref:sensor histidine kinase n=1 Tax=Aquibacillus kalidii TaxID=2762597 RepID=UPI001645A2B3|nr:sensor histidine kinase [Aquibacillus kalidii]